MPIHDAKNKIPAKALKALEQVAELEEGEQLVYLYDRSFWGSGKEGVAVTDRRLICYGPGGAEPHRFDQLGQAQCRHVDGAHWSLDIVSVSGEPRSLEVYTNDSAMLRYVVERVTGQAVAPSGGYRDSALKPKAIPLVEDVLVSPLCPHCHSDLDQIGERELRTRRGQRFVFYCPRCRKVLGFAAGPGEPGSLA